MQYVGFRLSKEAAKFLTTQNFTTVTSRLAYTSKSARYL